MQVCKIKEQGHLALFEVRVDDEDPPIKIWSTDEKHAIREATICAAVANMVLTSHLLNMLCQEGR